MRIPVFGRVVDERFLNHRLRSTSLAGIVGGVLASLLFAYRCYFSGVWSWDLFAVAVTIVGTKRVMMAWYLVTDQKKRGRYRYDPSKSHATA
jgi:hypothetical protein